MFVVVTDKCELVQPKERVEGSSSQAEGVSTHVQGTVLLRIATVNAKELS